MILQRGKSANGKPKREKKEKAPRQARNFFISLNFAKVRAEPGMDANAVMGECNKRWAALSEEDKQPYLALERNDKKRSDRAKGVEGVEADEEVNLPADLLPGSEEEEGEEAAAAAAAAAAADPAPFPEPLDDSEESE